jgi:hypothetical protein
MGNAHRAHPLGLRGYALDRRTADKRLVLFQGMKPEGGPLNRGAEHRHQGIPYGFSIVITTSSSWFALGNFATAQHS